MSPLVKIRDKGLSSLWKNKSHSITSVHLSSMRVRDQKFQDHHSSSNMINTWKKNTIAKASIVKVVLIEAKDLVVNARNKNEIGLFCKIGLGPEQYVSKQASSTIQPEWRERFKFHLHHEDVMKISLMDSERSEEPVASCSIFLSTLKKGLTHYIWQELDGNRGLVHLSITVCRKNINSTTTKLRKEINETEDSSDSCLEFGSIIGQLHVTVHEIKGLPVMGLNGKISAFCTLELDNERAQTSNVIANPTLRWDKRKYTFNIYNITSALTIKVCHKSIMTSFQEDIVGRIAIPLLRVGHDQTRWYALKDKSRRNHAKGQCPRILLETSISWDAIKASLRLFRPKHRKSVRRPSPKYDLGLLYKNVEFIKNCFELLYNLNEFIKEFLEWDDEQRCEKVLSIYLICCFFFRLWMTPLLLLAPFFYQLHRQYKKFIVAQSYTVNVDTGDIEINANNSRDETTNKSISGRIHNLQDMTVTLTGGIEYVGAVYRRLYNLTNFEVPFLSWLAIILIFVLTMAFYYLPFNYILMALGIYKYGRKRLQPNRVLNNDVLDFISHVPDRSVLKDWKELEVPEYEMSKIIVPTKKTQVSCDNTKLDISSPKEEMNETFYKENASLFENQHLIVSNEHEKSPTKYY